MRKALPLPAIVGAIVLALLVVGALLIVPLTKSPGPDATGYRPPTAEELARDHATPPSNAHGGAHSAP